MSSKQQAKGRNVVVIGTQWGDEGKGKVVDWLTDHAKAVVRFQGGHMQATPSLLVIRKRFSASFHLESCIKK